MSMKMSMGAVIVLLSWCPLILFAQAAEGTDPGEAAERGQAQAMQSRMEAMHRQMAQIRATSDPEERQRLMREHMQSMHQGMRAMGEMMRGGEEGRPPGDGPQEPAPPCADNDVQCQMRQMQGQQRMLQRHMEMMRMMMEQMAERHMLHEQMQHEGANRAP